MAQWVENLPAVQEPEETQVPAEVRRVPRRREWQPTSVFLPEKSHRQRSLASYSPKGCEGWTRLRHTQDMETLL